MSIISVSCGKPASVCRVAIRRPSISLSKAYCSWLSSQRSRKYKMFLMFCCFYCELAAWFQRGAIGPLERHLTSTVVDYEVVHLLLQHGADPFDWSGSCVSGKSTLWCGVALYRRVGHVFFVSEFVSCSPASLVERHKQIESQTRTFFNLFMHQRCGHSHGCGGGQRRADVHKRGATAARVSSGDSQTTQSRDATALHQNETLATSASHTGASLR